MFSVPLESYSSTTTVFSGLQCIHNTVCMPSQECVFSRVAPWTRCPTSGLRPRLTYTQTGLYAPLPHMNRWVRLYGCTTRMKFPQPCCRNKGGRVKTLNSKAKLDSFCSRKDRFKGSKNVPVLLRFTTAVTLRLLLFVC